MLEAAVPLNPAIAPLVAAVDQTLRPQLDVVSDRPHDPVRVRHLPAPWQLLGCGNYAAVVCHPDFPEQVVKVYAPGRPGFEAEVEVYRRLGQHPAFSECFYGREGVLILRRIRGTTLYDCLHQGILIPPEVIEDVDRALVEARSRGLFPHDVHGRNVMMQSGRGVVVDVSDFLKPEPCLAWPDLSRAYARIYWPIFSRVLFPVPYAVLDGLRAGYRLFRRWC